MDEEVVVVVVVVRGGQVGGDRCSNVCDLFTCKN